MRLISAGSLVRAQSGPLFRAISQVRCFPSVTNKNRLYARQTRDGVPIKHVISYYHQKRRVVSHGSDNGFAQSVQRSSKPFPLPKSRTIRHNAPMIPLLSGSMGASHTFCDWMLLYGVGLPAHAVTITVTNTNDSGPGSLRHALANANNLDTINFRCNRHHRADERWTSGHQERRDFCPGLQPSFRKTGLVSTEWVIV